MFTHSSLADTTGNGCSRKQAWECTNTPSSN